jgi:MSHA biogenesis protein MshM
MYKDFFHFNEMPFSLTPNTDFFCALAPHNEALKVILTALSMSEGFIKVTGEVGTGKTLLCRKLINHLSDRFVACYLPNPYLSPDELRIAFAKELGIKTGKTKERINLHNNIEEKLLSLKAGGRQAILIIDEAQALSWDSLEILRLFSNLETEKSKLLQIVLFGQPELNDNLDNQRVRQIRQRITFSYSLRKMTRAEIDYYIGHRLVTAGGDEGLIPRYLRPFVAFTSSGTPRLVNIVCHKLLLSVYGEGKKAATSKHLVSAILDTEDCRRRVLPQKRLFFLSLALVAALGTWQMTLGGL